MKSPALIAAIFGIFGKVESASKKKMENFSALDKAIFREFGIC